MNSSNALALPIVLALLASCAPPRTRHLPAKNAIGPYSAAVAAGDLVFVSGKIGTRGGAFSDEVGTAIDAIEADLSELGLSLSDVVSVQVFLTDIGLYAELNAAYAARFREPHPARTTVAVSALPGGARVEIQAVAARGAGGVSR